MNATAENLALWESIHANRDWGRWPCEDLVRFVARTFPDTAKHALEVGCGQGANISLLLDYFEFVYAIDGSRTAVDKARDRYLDTGRLETACGNFSCLPWPQDWFDFVADIEAIYANTPYVIAATIGEIHRILKPGGWFFGKMFGHSTSAAVLAGTGLAHMFDGGELAALFRQFAVFKLDWVKRQDGDNTIFEWIVQAQK